MSDYFDRVEQQIVREVRARARRRRGFAPKPAAFATAASVAVVIAVAAVFIGVRGQGSGQGAGGGRALVLVYEAMPTPRSAVTAETLGKTVALLRERAAQLGSDARISDNPATHQITVATSGATALGLAELVQAPRIFFYDWEAGALTPNGRTVARQLLRQDPQALAISGGGSRGPGVPGAGSMALYDAVKLAAQQPTVLSDAHMSHIGAEYYEFGRGGTPACRAAARLYGVAEAPAGTHCLLAGPASTRAELQSGLPPRVSSSEGRVLAVPQGTVVLEAIPPNFDAPPKIADPATQFYVRHDNVALYGNDIANAQASTDPGGNPDIELTLSPVARAEFHALTATIARRGTIDSPPGQALYQHFAVALDNLLITVPSIDFKTYPFGVPATSRIDLTAGWTAATARRLATELRLGSFPVALKLISESR